MKSILSIAAVILLSISGDNMKIELGGNPEKVKNSILKIIPVGSNINNARILMEKNGFKCIFMKDSSFSESGKVYDNIDFLYCDLEKGFIIGRRWQVAIIIKDLSVSEVLVSTGLTGP